jgi:hypothetical protein
MFRKIIFACLCLFLATASYSAVTFEGLPFAVQAAREALAAPALDSAKCKDVAVEAVRLTTVFPNSSLVPEVLMLAASLQKAVGNYPEALALSRKVVETWPKAESAPEAFDIAWSLLTNDGKIPLKGADLAKNFAAALGNSSAGRYCLLAFNAYKTANRWQDALDAGALYLKSGSKSNDDAAFLLSYADVALLSGNSPHAQKSLEEFISRFADQPQIVPARTKLASIYKSAGNDAGANENHSQAWSAYQKNSKLPAWRETEVAHAAAQSLWELQVVARRKLDELTALSGSLNKGKTKSAVEAILSAYSQIMEVDPDLTPKALNAQGDVHARYADALLKEGFRTVTKPSKTESPYDAAMPEYNLAIALYNQAYDKAQQAEQSGEAQQAARYAASRAFEVTSDQGDVLYAWGLDLSRQGPEVDPAKGPKARIEYLAQTVTPLLKEGLNYKSAALNLAQVMPLKSEAARLRQTLDLPFLPVGRDMLAMSHGQITSLKSQASQLASTLTFGFQINSATPLAKDLEANYERTTNLAAYTQDALNTLYSALEPFALSAKPAATWDSLMTASFYDYTSACRTVQDNLNVCVASLSVQKDENAETLKNRLTKLQGHAASAEMTNLVSWHDFAARNDVRGSLADRLEARLAELDPGHFKIIGDPSANRKKP